MLNNVCLTITEDAGGANGPERAERFARIESAAAVLVDWVYESLIEDDVELETNELRAVQRLVARAMITQRDFDQEMLASALTAEVGEPPAAVPW